MPSALGPRFPSGRGLRDQCDCINQRGGGNVRTDRHVVLRREFGNATSARFFKALGRTIRTKLAGNDRTFGCRHRHIGVGDFSAQYLNGRRQAMIFRLRGVALFNDQFVAYQPSGNGRYGQTRWLSLAGPGGSEANVLTRGAAGVERSARRRHAHCKFIVVVPGRSILLKKFASAQNRKRVPEAARSFSNCARSLEKPAPVFNRSGRLCTRSKVDRLG